MMRRLLLLALLNLAATASLHAEQAAYALRDATLHAEPYSDTRIIAELRAKENIIVIERRGGWYRTRTVARQEGWVRMSAIRLGEHQTGESGIGETLRILESGRSGADGITVATGIRGLNAADMANANPNHHAATRLERYRVGAAQARAFAAEGELGSRQFPYMEERADNDIPGIGEDW